ncbi:hypothetical protein ScPMuIL_006912 [Solemya velum]
MVSGGESSEDWYIDGSDDEKYNPSQEEKGLWRPRAENILELFDRLETEKVLELSWKCPGRRPPDQEEEEEVDTCPDTSMEVEADVKIEQKPQIPTEFDFDDSAADIVSTKMTPRTPGSKTPRTPKRATMDKVLHDIFIQKKQHAAEREARRLAGGRSPKTPFSARSRYNSPSSPMGQYSPLTHNVHSPASSFHTPVSSKATSAMEVSTPGTPKTTDTSLQISSSSHT